MPTGTLSLTAGKVWVGTPNGLHTLTGIPVDGGPTTTLDLSPAATPATVNGNLIAYRQDSSGRGGGAVCVTTISDPTRCHSLKQASAIYSLTVVHSDGRHVVMLVDAGTSQLLEVGHPQ